MTSDERPIDKMDDMTIRRKRNMIQSALESLETSRYFLVEAGIEDFEELDSLIDDAKESVALATMELDKRAAERAGN